MLPKHVFAYFNRAHRELQASREIVCGLLSQGLEAFDPSICKYIDRDRLLRSSGGYPPWRTPKPSKAAVAFDFLAGEARKWELVALTLSPGACVPLHDHPNHVVSLVIDGSLNVLELGRDGQVLRCCEQSIADGAISLSTPGGLHAFSNTSDRICTVLDVLLPPYNTPSECTYYEVDFNSPAPIFAAGESGALPLTTSKYSYQYSPPKPMSAPPSWFYTH